MDNLKNILHEGSYSCVIESGGDVRTFSRRGVVDLYLLLRDEPEFLERAKVADKVIGKAGASLLVMGRIASLYTDVISTPALELLHDYGVEVSYDLEVPKIINRDKTGLCPLETLTLNQYDMSEIFNTITQFLSEKGVI